MTAIVPSGDVQEIVSKLSSDKAKAREVFSLYFPALSSPLFSSQFGGRENADEKKEKKKTWKMNLIL